MKNNIKSNMKSNIKTKLANKIFKKELKELREKLEHDLKREYNYQFMRKNAKLTREIQINGIVDKILAQDFAPYIMLVGKSRHDEVLVAAIRNDDIYIYDHKSGRPVINLKTERLGYYTKIQILDIKTEKQEDGYGTFAMKALMKYAKDVKALIIWGELSLVDEKDKDNKIRRDLLYQKNGFSNDRKKVKLILNSDYEEN